MKLCRQIENYRLFQLCLSLKLHDRKCNFLWHYYFFFLPYLIDVRDLRLSTLQFDCDRVLQSQGFSGTLFLATRSGSLPFFDQLANVVHHFSIINLSQHDYLLVYFEIFFRQVVTILMTTLLCGTSLFHDKPVLTQLFFRIFWDVFSSGNNSDDSFGIVCMILRQPLVKMLFIVIFCCLCEYEARCNYYQLYFHLLYFM